MSGRKKKLSVKLKRYNVILIIALIVLMLLLGILMVAKMFGNSSVYKVEPRERNIAMSKSKDGNDFKTIGWVRVQGTNIDYPLYGLIDYTYDYPVTDSYLWSLNMDKEFHNLMIVYGHNVMNLGPNPVAHDDSFTRMEELMNFVYYDFAKENQFVQLSMNGENYLYKVFAINFINVHEVDEFPTGEWPEDVAIEYVERLRKESIYDYDVDVKDDDKVISVVTCTRFFGDKSYDFIVTGRLVRTGEAVSLSKVYRNKNYVQIEEKMKGAAADEKSTDEA